MPKRISDRVKGLERGADKDVYDQTAMIYAIAYYLGGARRLSDVIPCFAEALGLSFKRLNQEVANAWLKPDELGDVRLRASKAYCEVFKRFGYDPEFKNQRDFADAMYEIIKHLPEDWRAQIKSAYWEWREAEREGEKIMENARRILHGGSSPKADKNRPLKGGRNKGCENS